jgi:hypothetical protein
MTNLGRIAYWTPGARKFQAEAQRSVAVPPRFDLPEEAILARDDDVTYALDAARGRSIFE